KRSRRSWLPVARRSPGTTTGVPRAAGEWSPPRRPASSAVPSSPTSSIGGRGLPERRRTDGGATAGERGIVDPGVRAPPGVGAARRLHRARQARPRGEDALLLLRPAVRRAAAGEGRAGGRRRAVGGVSLQRREALPERREAVPAEQ